MTTRTLTKRTEKAEAISSTPTAPEVPHEVWGMAWAIPAAAQAAQQRQQQEDAQASPARPKVCKTCTRGKLSRYRATLCPCVGTSPREDRVWSGGPWGLETHGNVAAWMSNRDVLPFFLM
eukprot:4980250-Pyramimonas_sp.AAC.1